MTRSSFHPRQLALLSTLLLVGAGAIAAPTVTGGGVEGVSDDIFELSQGTVVLESSPLLACCNGAPAENTFGGTGGVEGVHTLFADGAPAESIDFINFQTGSPIELTGYTATLADDSDNPANPGDPNRGSTSFSLFVSPDATFAAPVLISTTPLLMSYSTNYGTNGILITDSFAPVIGEFFRIEITRATAGGPRIREVDGVGTVVPEPASGALLALAAFGLAMRQRRSSH